MFFPTRIKSIDKHDRVLEVGPGNNPFYRSDVLLEKRFDDAQTALRQAGGVERRALGKETVYYDGGTFPFEDDAFDYVICSHVIEHVPVSELGLFIAELSRVAKKGYLEFPSYRFEMINDIEEHVNLISLDEQNKFYVLSKESMDLDCSSYVHLRQIIRESKIAHKVGTLNPERLAFGFEFSGHISYEIVEQYDVLLALDEDSDAYLETDYTLRYLWTKIARQFNKNIFLQKWHNRFGRG